MSRQGDSEELGQRIRSGRKAKDWSVRELARRMNLNHSSIVRIEQGEFIRVKSEHLEQFSTLLDLPLADLQILAGYKPVDDLPDLKTFLHVRYRDLPDQDVEEIDAHVRFLRAKIDRQREGADK